jgi:hypothetical protein
MRGTSLSIRRAWHALLSCWMSKFYLWLTTKDGIVWSRTLTSSAAESVKTYLFAHRRQVDTTPRTAAITCRTCVYSGHMSLTCRRRNTSEGVGTSSNSSHLCDKWNLRQVVHTESVDVFWKCAPAVYYYGITQWKTNSVQKGKLK